MGFQLWRQCLHNLWISQVELPIAVQLSPVAAGHTPLSQGGRKPVQQLVAVALPIHAAAFVLLDIQTDKPVAQRQAHVPGPRRLGCELLTSSADAGDEQGEGTQAVLWAHTSSKADIGW